MALKVGHYPMLISCKVDGKLPKKQAVALDIVAMQTGAHAILAYRTNPGTVTVDEVSQHGRCLLYTLRIPPRKRPKKKAKGPEADPLQMTIYDALDEAAAEADYLSIDEHGLAE